MIEYGEFSAIFTGDADGLSEDAAAANFSRAVKATVLSASHHGAQSHKSNSAEWAEATSPKIMIYSSGTKHGHPRCAATSRYTASLASAPAHETHCNTTNDYDNRTTTTTTRAEYVTDVVGSITVTSTGAAPALLTCEGTVGCSATIPH